VENLVRIAQTLCDGVFVQRAVGVRRTREDGVSPLRTQLGTRDFVVAASPTRPHGTGVRRMLFGATCRKNFGCSHVMLRADARANSGPLLTGALQDLHEWLSELGLTAIGRDAVARITRSRAHSLGIAAIATLLAAGVDLGQLVFVQLSFA
jgi:hypothetical protein